MVEIWTFMIYENEIISNMIYENYVEYLFVSFDRNNWWVFR